MIPLAAFEEIIDASGAAARIEAMLPAGVRPRQLRVRTLLAGMCLAQADHRPARLTRVHQALTALSEDDQRRLGVIADWKNGPHLLTCRQTERTFGLVADALAGDEPGGLPSVPLQAACDDLPEASIPEQFKDGSRSLAVDWTDLESFSRPPPHGTSDCADPEASWGHRSGGGPGQDSELFFGYYASAATMMREEHGPAVPELARRMTVCSSKITGSGFRHLRGMKQLESINLHSSPASDAGLEAIGKLTSLRVRPSARVVDPVRLAICSQLQETGWASSSLPYDFGTSLVNRWPISSLSWYPNIFSAAGLTEQMTPFSSTMIMPSRMFSMIERMRVSTPSSLASCRRTMTKL
jgi:hypothetical protein